MLRRDFDFDLDLNTRSPLVRGGEEEEGGGGLGIGKDVKSGLLFDLPTFDLGLVVDDVGGLLDESISSMSSSSPSLECLDVPKIIEQQEEEDVCWTDLQPSAEDHDNGNAGYRLLSGFKSWERFYGKMPIAEPRTMFLSEGGSQVYDAAIVKSAESIELELRPSISGHVIRSEAMLSSLMQLALGRESLLFHYNEEEKSFRSRKDFLRMSGYSLPTFEHFSESLRIQANRFKELRDFIAHTQRSETASRVAVSLAGAMISILASLEIHIGSPSTRRDLTLLQLQAIMERPSRVLICLTDVVAINRHARSDEEILSRIFSFVQDAEHAPPWLLVTLYELLIAASQPWLDSVAGWLGLQQSNDCNPTLDCPAFVVARHEDIAIDAKTTFGSAGFDFASTAIPSFLSATDALIIFETGRTLRLLEKHQPDHPLAKQSVSKSVIPSRFEWKFTWDSIGETSAAVKEYEAALGKASHSFHSKTPATDQRDLSSSLPDQQKFDTASQAKPSTLAVIKQSQSVIEAPLPEITPSTTFSETSELNAFDTFALPLSLLATLSFNPLIRAHSRLVNDATLRLLFRTYHLRAHLSILHRFTLLSDGVFISRLSHALFSPQTQTLPTAHQRRPILSPGLNLGHRSSWPPASSELRLALTGILTDVYFDSPNLHLSSSSTNYSSSFSSSLFSTSRTDLPGNISFAIHPMTVSELELCSDPNTLPALDFLRLQYTPPPPLNEIITPSSLVKYDKIFTCLLRCHRMLAAVTQLSTATTMTEDPLATPQVRVSRTQQGSRIGNRDPWARFRWESYCFVTAVSAWMFDGVAAQWRLFDTWLAQVERDSAADGHHDHHQNEGRMQGQGSGERNTIPHLRISHTHYLDRIFFALLLRKRQGQVNALLEEILSLVLRFAWLAGHGAGADSSSASGSGKSEGVSSGTILRGDDDNNGLDEPQREGREENDMKVKEKDHAGATISELHVTFKRKTAAFVHLCWDVSLVGMKKKEKKEKKEKKKKKKSTMTKEKERRNEEEKEGGQGVHDPHHDHHRHHHDDDLALLIDEGGDEDNDDDEDEDKDEDYAREAMAALVGRLEMAGF